MTPTQKITPFLWFDTQAEDAAKLYTSIFDGSKIVEVTRRGDKVFSVVFEVAGQRVFALNGGPMYKLTPAFSLFVSCETQDEIDRYWDALLAGGGEPSRCGWLRDRYGVSWQIVPKALGQLLDDPDPGRAKRAMEAMLGMVKLDIAALERAARNE